ncbi:hypothetical protein [Streptomyces sp. NPDC005784]|uniref:hypothetical protein n=1 Tax=Streptomyces sp. NPDC005784 TaxID=3364731 RepID=UPI0036C4869A
MCATGVLCGIGAPVAAVGATGIVRGAYVAVDGAGNLGKGLGKALNEASSESSGASSVDAGAKNPDITWKTDDWDGWGHVQETHRVGAELYNPETKGAFIGKGAKVQKWIQQVVKNNPARRQTEEGRDGYEYSGRVNAGPDGVGILSEKQVRGLGSNRGYGVTVVLNRDGSLRTAYPIP